MTITVEKIFTYACDWPSCRMKLVARGFRTMEEADEYARRNGWTMALSKDHPLKGRQSRCYSHAYKFKGVQHGRPRRRLGMITTLPVIREGKCTGCRQRPDPETGACRCGDPRVG